MRCSRGYRRRNYSPVPVLHRDGRETWCLRSCKRAAYLAEQCLEDAGNSAIPWVATAAESDDYRGSPVRRDKKRPIYLLLLALSGEAATELLLRGMENDGCCNGVFEDCGRCYFAAYLVDLDASYSIDAGIRAEAEL